MDLDALLSRRDFLDFLKGAVALAVSPSFPDVAVAQPKPRDTLRSPYDSIYIESLPISDLEPFKEPYTPNIFKQAKDIEEIVARLPILRWREVSLVKSFYGPGVKFLPDKEAYNTYTNRFIEEAKKSIDHIFNFLRSDYLRKPNVNFVVPGSIKDVVMVDTSPEITIYLVADLIRGNFAVYKFEGIEQEFNTGFGKKMPGGLFGRGRVSPNYAEDFQFSPVFLNLSSDTIFLYDAPPNEVLHRVIRQYTLRHIERELRDRGVNLDNLKRLEAKYTGLEEKFVHALSILWLKRYNADAKLGFSDSELEERFKLYESSDLYRGANQLARHISKIGVQKAIELYITNPDKLFSAAGMK